MCTKWNLPTINSGQNANDHPLHCGWVHVYVDRRVCCEPISITMFALLATWPQTGLMFQECRCTRDEYDSFHHPAYCLATFRPTCFFSQLEITQNKRTFHLLVYHSHALIRFQDQFMSVLQCDGYRGAFKTTGFNRDFQLVYICFFFRMTTFGLKYLPIKNCRNKNRYDPYMVKAAVLFSCLLYTSPSPRD